MIQQKNSLNPTIQKSSLSLSTFIRQMLRGWPWFLVAFILFVLISLWISSNLQLGVAEYKMTIMSRYKDLSKEIRTNNGDKDYIWDKEPPYSVEQLYGFCFLLILYTKQESKWDLMWITHKGKGFAPTMYTTTYLSNFFS